MAGYLGKISAIVSANTADFASKLNGSAKEVRKFASSIESTIGAASRQAATSLANIYTPLQKLERALQAAGKMPLSFNGFAGAIKNIDALKQRLASGLNDRQIAVVVKASGMASVDEFLKAIQGVNSKTVDIITKVGGLEQLRELRAQMLGSKGAAKLDIDVSAARAKVENLRQQLAAAMEGGAGGDARAVGRLERQLATATQALEVLKKAASSGDAAFVKKLDRDISTVADKLRDLEGRRLRAINAGVDSSKIADIGKQIDKTAAKLERLENKKTNIGVSTDEFDEKIAEAESKVARLRKQLEEAKSTGGASGVAAIKEELAAAEKQADSLAAKLNKKVGVDAKTGLSLSDVNAAIAGAERLGISLEKARQVAAELGESDYEAAATQLRRLASVSEEITKPLGEAAKTLASLGADVQGGFLQTLTNSQAAAEKLVEAIKQGVQPTAAIESFFAEVKASADAAADAVARLSGASQALAGLKTGKELVFSSPELASSLARGAEIGSAAASLPGSAIAANPQIVERLAEIKRLSDLAVAALSKLEAAKLGNFQREIDEQASKLQNLLRLLDGVQAKAADEIKVIVDTEEAKKKIGDLEADMESLADRKRRAEVASTMLPVLGRESDLLSYEGAATQLPPGYLEKRAFAKAEQVRAAAREEQRKRRAEVASTMLPPVLSRESDLLSNQGAATKLPDGYLAARAAAKAAQQQQQAFREEIDRTAAAATAFRSKFGGAGLDGVTKGLDQIQLRGYEAQLQILQQALSRVNAEARGPGVAAFNALAEAIENAMMAGTLSAPETQKEIARLTTAAVGSIGGAAGSGTSAAALGNRVAQAGDVGRAGVDKFSLALNQAAFAVDDFMSSTGGIEFKLRAISNNITQLAFVLGGTTGLFIGLGAVIGGQVAVAIMKWVNGGRTAEDQTKALNDALARQKSLVEELAQAFRGLGDAMTRGAFSELGGRSRDIDRAVDDIRKKQGERRRESVAGVDPAVLRERATQQSLNRQISQQTDVGQILNLQRQLRESQERERAAADAATSKRPLTAGDVGGELRESFRRMTDAAVMDAQDEAAAAFARAKGDRRQADFVSPEDVRQAREAILARQKELGAAADSNAMLSPNIRAEAREEIRRLQAILESLGGPLRKALDESANNVVEASRGPAEQIRLAQEEVARAIEAGVPGAREFQRQLDRNAARLAEAYKTLELATSGLDKDGRPLDADQTRQKVEEARAAVAQLESRRSGLAAQADALSYQRVVDPQQQFSAIMDRSRGNLRDAGLGDGTLARRLREIEAEREQLRARASMPEFQSPEMVRSITAAEEALKEEASAIEAATIAIKMFSDTLDRASQEAKGNLSAAQQSAEAARRNDLGMETPLSAAERARAERDFRTQRGLEAASQRAISNQRAREEEILRGREFSRMREIDSVLAAGTASPAQQRSLREERGRLEAQVQPRLDEARRSADAAIEASTREEERRKRALRGADLIKRPDQKFAEETAAGLGDIREFYRRNAPNDAAGLAAQEQQFSRQRQEEARTQTLAGRGAEAALTDFQKFALDIRRPGGLVESIDARRRQLAGQGVDAAGQANFLRTALAEQMGEVAPMLKGFDEERRNAMLQGPSRAALNVSDITTGQGMSELNRLLRGDDPAKDVNLAELRKQTEKFDELIRAVRDANPGLIP